jgi:aminoglycoside phosphotransferase (APT) family kinase protein
VDLASLGDPIGSGRTAEVYDWPGGRVLKLLLPDLPHRWIEHEAALTTAVRNAGAPAPAVHQVVRIEDRPGIVFDRAGEKSMLQDLEDRPWRGLTLARRLAGLHADLFRCRGAELPQVKERLAAKIDAAGALSADQRRRARDALRGLPAGDSVLHGDLHPDNIFMAGSKATIIDWSEASRGHPAADIARSLITMSVAAIPPDMPRARLIRLLIGMFRQRYTRTCLERAGLERGDLDPWHLPVTAARLSEEIEHETEALVAAVKRMLDR